ncbi:MAG: hypothetical protein LUI09_05170 [Prevotellaceae bacterium]|nr:hypothetical protein [Prevotellaceae bacterium]
MKKIAYLMIMACAGALLASCDKDEPGGTATEALAGEWYVTYDAVDADGNLIEQDIYGMGHTKVYTYNTAENTSTTLYVDDQGEFWEYKVRVNCDVGSLTFSSTGSVPNEYYDCNVLIEDGKILKGAATNPHGTAADSIVFYVTFDDDPYIGYIYDKLRVTGYRYTGLASDDD